MKKRSKGIKRIVLRISILLPLGWIIFIAMDTEFFSSFSVRESLIVIIIAIIAFLIPQFLRIVIYWIIDGLRKIIDMSQKISNKGNFLNIVSSGIIILLLIAILATQILMLLHMPPTRKDLINAKTTDERKKLLQRVPYVHVNGRRY